MLYSHVFTGGNKNKKHFLGIRVSTDETKGAILAVDRVQFVSN